MSFFRYCHDRIGYNHDVDGYNQLTSESMTEYVQEMGNITDMSKRALKPYNEHRANFIFKTTVQIRT